VKTTITQIGDAQGIFLDSQLLQLSRLGVGDLVNVEVHASGTINIVPLNPRVSAASRLRKYPKSIFSTPVSEDGL